MSKSADWADIAQSTLDAFGRIDIVVNNAGVSHRNQPMLEVDEAEFDRVYAVNVKSIYLGAALRAGVSPTGRRLLRAEIASRLACVRARPHVVQRLERRGDPGPASRWRWSWRRTTSASSFINPVAGGRRCWPPFMGEDTPRNALCSALPSRSVVFPLRDIANAALFLGQ